MNLSLVQEQAITARMALIVGAKEFDRLFLGVEFVEVDGDILYVLALNDDLATELEEKYATHIATVASRVLKRPIDIVMVLPKQLTLQ
jgi:hypothetical protein